MENEMDLTTIHPENEVRAGTGFILCIALQTFVDFFFSRAVFSVKVSIITDFVPDYF